jgi:hypothetical protein
VTSEKLGDGVCRLTTGAGSYDSLIVDFRDHIMMLEAGQSEAQALAYIAEAKKLIPNKPIRYVMNTHAKCCAPIFFSSPVPSGSTTNGNPSAQDPRRDGPGEPRRVSAVRSEAEASV